MKRNFWRLVLVVLAATLLIGCTEDMQGSLGTELLHTPGLSAQQLAVQQAVTDYLGENVTLKYPMGGDVSSPYFWWDADGDGIQELLVMYQNTAKSKNVQLAVLRQGTDGWYAAHMDIEGAAGDVDGLRSIRMDDGEEYLLAGYQDSTGLDWTVCLYQWSDGALREKARLACQQYVSADLDDSGSEQLVMVQYNEVYGNLQLRVYGPASAENAELFLEERFVNILDSRFERCLFMQLSPSPSGGVTLVMDFEDGSGNSLGEVMTYQNTRFIRCYADEGSNVPNFTARPFTGLLPADQDGDDALEMPRVETPVFGSSSAVRFYLVSWYNISGSTRLRSYSLVDVQEGYVLTLPESWRGLVTLQEDGSGVWSLRSIENGTRRAWFCLAEERPDSDYLSIGDLGTQKLYIQFPEQTSLEDRLVILNGFRALYR